MNDNGESTKYSLPGISPSAAIFCPRLPHLSLCLEGMTSGHVVINEERRQRRRDPFKNLKRPVIPKVKCPRNKYCNWFRKPDNVQLILTISAVAFGLIIGVAIKFVHPNISSRTVDLVAFPGTLLMNMLKMLIIPLITSSLISGLANLDTKSCGKIGTYALIYYFTTTLMAVILGIVLVVAIHPGNPGIKESHVSTTTPSKTSPHTLDAFLDLFRNMFPENIIQACTKQVLSQMRNVTVQVKVHEGNTTVIKEFVEEIAKATFIDNTNVLGLVTFSVAFGLGIASMGKQGRLMLDFFIIMNEIIMRLVRVIMWYAPIGIIFLIIGQIIAIDDLMSTVTGLGLYMLTVIAGLAIHLFLTLMLMYFIICRKNPLVYMRGLFQAFFMALGTGSSSATLPVTFKCLEENLGIDARVTRFVLPIGATVNMDGTALYEAVACIFIAQINEYTLSVGQLVTISITATLAAIGAAAVPSAGLVTMVMVLTSVGLPINDIALIFAVDWMLDRIRTSINVMGDAFGAGIVAHLCREQLRVPAKRLNSISVAVPRTKWNDNQEDSGDECEGENSNSHDASIELVEATLTERE
ncbi:Excitatory amino acid transporter 2 [Taenia crassiceps]|uniref:Amino acid transporter n=1 Tax=Taenia crassiceps TaxID=6207 RepID=A0ABR4Q8J2_9CEST